MLAVCAFNIELSRVAEAVREPHLGAIRLQWWRDAVAASAAGEAVGQPVADAIAAVQIRYALPDRLLQGMIDARELDLDCEPVFTFAALRDYLNATAGAVFEAGARICGTSEAAAKRMAAHAGIAYGLTGLMRALPFHASRGKLFIPLEMLNRHGVDPAALLCGTEAPGLRALLLQLRVIAAAELDAARACQADIPAEARAVFLPLALIDAHLSKLAAPRHRPLHDIAELNPLAHVWRLWHAHRRGRI